MAGNITELKSKFTDKYIKADERVAELARFKGMVGRVVTVNESGKALVDFGDGPWYDLPLDRLTITEKPAAEPKTAHKK